MLLAPLQADNFFMSCELADFRLTAYMTLVSTVKLNKPESAALFMNGKESPFFYISCTSNLTTLSYVAPRNKTIIIFS
jgi:hypothetical protein